jgi:hypothetical protein
MSARRATDGRPAAAHGLDLERAARRLRALRFRFGMRLRACAYVIRERQSSSSSRQGVLSSAREGAGRVLEGA